MPVEIVRDWVDVLLVIIQITTLIVTMGAVVLAYLEIKLGREDARAALAAQSKDRRIDFELTVLRELVVAVERVDPLRLRALASTLPQEVVPLTRAAAVLPSTEEAERVAPQSPPEGGWTGTNYRVTFNVERLKNELTDELVQAIDQRVRERVPA